MVFDSNIRFDLYSGAASKPLALQFRPMKKFLLLCLLSATAAAQTLSPSVREYVKIDAPTIVLTNVRVIDGTGAAALENRTVILAGGKIQGIEDTVYDRLVPKDAIVLDLTGHTVLPGMVMLHEHLFYPAGGAVFHEMAYSFPRLYLAAGVTTIRTGGSIEPYTDLEIKKLIDAGQTPGPKMHVTGPYLEGKGSFTPQMHAISDPDDARRTVNFWADQGATSFKAYNFITRDELKAAIEAAHARGLKVTGHLCSIGLREAAELGIDDLEHGLVVDTEFFPEKKPDQCPNPTKAVVHLTSMEVSGPEIQQTIRVLVEKKVAVTSTLPVFEMFIPGRPATPQRILDAMSENARVSFLTSAPAWTTPPATSNVTAARTPRGSRPSAWSWSSSTPSPKPAGCSSQASIPQATAAPCPASAISAKSSCWSKPASPRLRPSRSAPGTARSSWASATRSAPSPLARPPISSW